ncbi:hypothetical protein ACFQZJ_03165 [Maribacter chungangensis]|uniref:Uncharacterized protein n=1 Tax=Maribacter chungangensis TaxID=1069117 RepID=A0ABW3AZW8_9FLAO
MNISTNGILVLFEMPLNWNKSMKITEASMIGLLRRKDIHVVSFGLVGRCA